MTDRRIDNVTRKRKNPACEAGMIFLPCMFSNHYKIKQSQVN